MCGCYVCTCVDCAYVCGLCACMHVCARVCVVCMHMGVCAHTCTGVATTEDRSVYGIVSPSSLQTPKVSDRG